MDLSRRYLKEIEKQNFNIDPEQQLVIDGLRSLRSSLDKRATRKSIFTRLWQGGNKSSHSHSLGCYIWGGVGRGKSWLMDMFLKELNAYSHARMHYQEFMRQVHLSLNQAVGHKDPLRLIAKRFADQWRVIGLDEFAVSDIADAMLWHGLLEALRDCGAILIITSNQKPEDLYADGLQRQSFLPAIDTINHDMQVLELGGDTDYRRVKKEDQKRYYFPADERADKALNNAFQNLAGPIFQQGRRLLINRRQIEALQLGNHTAWFEFKQLCQGPRSASDYLELSHRFRTVFISRVPVFDEHKEDQAWRFVQLIDEFYDRHIQIFISAQCEIERLYRGRRYQFEFRRTISRLHEMQSKHYCRPLAVS